MVVVLEHGKNFGDFADHFKISCKCGCKFICTKWDFSQYDNNFLDKMGKKSIHCPDCHEKIYITGPGEVASAKGILEKKEYPITSIQYISKEKYEELSNPDFS